MEAQIANFKPDIIYIQDIAFLRPRFLSKIKKYSTFIVGQIACPIPPKKYLLPYDLIISSLPHYINFFKSLGKKSEYLPLAFESSIINKLTRFSEQYDTIFIGGLSSVHKKGTSLFEDLDKKIKIDFWGYGANDLKSTSFIRRNYNGEAWGLDMYNILFNSQISINRHIDIAENFANNMRLYETTGVGTFLITDYKDNLNDIFKIGEEIETYNSGHELAEKISYYLDYPEKRKKIAKAGQETTLRNYNYKVRMKELIKILNRYL